MSALSSLTTWLQRFIDKLTATNCVLADKGSHWFEKGKRTKFGTIAEFKKMRLPMGLMTLEDRITPHGPGFSEADVAFGMVEPPSIPVPFPNYSFKTKPAPMLADGSHEANILTIVLDFKEPTQANTSDIFGNVVGAFDVTSFGFTSADFNTVTKAIAAEVDQDYFSELIGTVAGPAGQDLRIDFMIGDIGTAPAGVSNYYYMQIGTGISGPNAVPGTLGVAGLSVVRNSSGTGPNSGVVVGDVVGSIFTNTINTMGGLTPSNALTSGNLFYTTMAVSGTLSHEIGHTLSLSHIDKAGSVQAVSGTAPLMGTGAVDLPNQDRLTDRSFSLSGVDSQNGKAARMHVQQLKDAVGLHSTTPTNTILLNAIGTNYTQNFDTLGNATTSTNTTTPSGWFFGETGSNANTTYTGNDGGSNAGDTYSYGTTSSTERAFGGLQSSNLTPTIGASFTNNTGGYINSLSVSYFGEQWRLGATGRTDRLDFQFSLNATSLTTGTWIDIDTLDFTAPNSTGTAGKLDGNLAANRKSVSSTIGNISFANGASVWFRWNSFDATGSDDGLAIDDFTITPNTSATIGLDGSNNLTITPAAGAVNKYAVKVNGNNYRITGADATNGFYSTIPTASGSDTTMLVWIDTVTGSQIFVNGGESDDLLTVDFSGGQFPDAISFDGGTGADSMSVIGTGTDYARHIYNYSNGTDGNIQFDVDDSGPVDYTLTYTNLAPLSNDGTPNDIVFNLPVGPIQAVLADDGTLGNSTSILYSAFLGGFEATTFANPTNSVTINNGGGGADTMQVNTAPDFARSLKLGSSAAPFFEIEFNDALTLASGFSLAAFATSSISLNNSADISTSGSGSIGLTTARTIVLDVGTSITTANGALTLSANETTATTGNFVGVDLNGATVQVTGSGQLSVFGRGGTTASNQVGVRVRSAGVLQAGTSGTGLVEGRGGESSGSSSDGVLVTGLNSKITSAGANVQVKGFGGGNAATSINRGVAIETNGQILSGGSGTVVVEGTGGNNGGSNYGVNVSSGSITSSGGNVQVTGFGGGNGTNTNNHGVLVNGGTITASGSASVSVTGAGGSATGGLNTGVAVLSGKITSGGGSVVVTGTEGGNSTNGYGVYVNTSGLITTLTNGGDVTLIANSVFLNVATSVSTQASNSVTIRQRTNGNSIDVGLTSDPIPGALGISNAEFGRIATGTLNLGNNNAGTLTVSAAMTPSFHLTMTTGAGVTANQSITMAAHKNLIVSATGTTNLALATSDFTTSGTGTINLTSSALIAANGAAVSSAATGAISVNADAISLTAGSAITASTGTVTIRPQSSSTQINLGGPDAAGVLGLTSTELDLIAAGTLKIGDGFSGDLTVTNAITQPATTNVELTSGGDVNLAATFDTNGGTLKLHPGTSPRAVKPTFAGTDASASTVSFGSDLAITITNVITYDQLTVAGIVDLTGVDLKLGGTHTPLGGQSFTIVSASGGFAGTTFNGLPEGATIANFLGSGLTATISYTGSGGTTAVLTVASTGTMTAVISGTDLVITDYDGGKDNNWTFSFTGTNFVITESIENFKGPAPGNSTISMDGKTLTIPATDFTGKVIFQGAGGSDTLTVNNSPNVFTRDIDFHGGTGTSDQLNFTGGTFATVTHTFSNANGGDIQTATSKLSYTGLEPVDMTGSTIADLVFNLPAISASNAILEDDGTSSNGKSRLRSSPVNFEQTDFSNPTNSLTINRGHASDSITVTDLPDFTKSLTIGSTANPFLAASGSGTIALMGSLSVSAATVTNTATLSATTVTLNTASWTNNGSLTASGGSITVTGAAGLTVGGNGSYSSATGLKFESASGNVTLGLAPSSIVGPLTVVANNSVVQSGGGVVPAGNATITATTGNIGALGNPILTQFASLQAAANNGATGGNVFINNTGTISVKSSAAAREFNLQATGSVNVFDYIDASAAIGNGGNITLVGGLNVTGGTLLTQGGSGGQGGNITLTATAGNINIAGNINSSGGGGAGGRGGDVKLIANAGTITVGIGGIDSHGNVNGIGGSVSITAGGFITVDGLINSQGSTGAAGKNGGAVFIQSFGDVLGVNNINASGGGSVGNGAGAGGSITLQAATGVNFGALTTTGGSSTGGGAGGQVMLVTTSGFILASGNITTSGGNGSGPGFPGGAGGSVQAVGGSISLQNVTTQGGAGLGNGSFGGAGGSFTFTANTGTGVVNQLNSSGGAGGSGLAGGGLGGGGSIFAQGNLILGGLDARGGLAGNNAGGSGASGGAGGSISITSVTSGINLFGDVNTSGGNGGGGSINGGGGGSGGNLKLEAATTINVNQLLAGGAAGGTGGSGFGGGGGAGGSITLKGGGSFGGGGGTWSSNGGAGGNSGSGSGGEGGHGGMINLQASDAFLSGPLMANGGNSGTGVPSSSGGNGGAITITTTAGDLMLGSVATQGGSGITSGADGNVVFNVVGTTTQTGSLTAGGLLLSGNGHFKLSNTGNNFKTLAADATNIVEVTDVDGFVVGVVNAVQGIANAVAASFRIGGGAVTQTEKIRLNEIQIISFGTAGDFTLTHPNNELNKLSGNAAGTVKIQDISTTLTIDKSSPALAQAASTGITAKKVDINTTGRVKNDQQVMVTFSDLIISGKSYSSSGSAAANPIEAPNMKFNVTEYFGDDSVAAKTKVSQMEGSAGGNVSIENKGATTINGITAKGQVTVTNQSPMTVAGDVVADGAILLTADEDAAMMPGDDLTLQAGVTVESTGSSVSLSAGDNVVIETTAKVKASATINVTYGDADKDGYSSLILDGSTTSGGDQTFTGNDVAIGAGASVNAAGNIVTIRPQEVGRLIDIGTNTIGKLSLTDPELDKITAGKIVIGADGSAAYPGAAAGPVGVSAAIQHAHDANVVVVTASQINVGANWTTTAGDLEFRSGAKLTVNGALVVGDTGDLTFISTSGDDSGMDILTSSVTTGGKTKLSSTATSSAYGLRIDTATISGTQGVSISAIGGSSALGDTRGARIAVATILSSAHICELVGQGGNAGGTSWGLEIIGGLIEGKLGVKVTGTSGNSVSDAIGLDIGGTTITATMGTVELSGEAGDSSGARSVGTILGGTFKGGPGTISLGVAGGSFTHSVGVLFDGVDSQGDFMVMGTGGVGTKSTGVSVAIGTDWTHSGTATIHGNGKDCNDSSKGIAIAGKMSGFSALTMEGTGGVASAGDSAGVFVDAGGQIIGSGTGNAAISGTGDDCDDKSDGIDFEGRISGFSSLTMGGTSAVNAKDSTGVFIGALADLDCDGPADFFGHSQGSNVGIGLRVAGHIDSTGTLSLTGTTDAGMGTTAVYADSSSHLQTQPLGGHLVIHGDSMTFVVGAAIGMANITATVSPVSAGRMINLGGADSATELGLTDAELNTITAGTLIIGDSDSGLLRATVNLKMTQATHLQFVSGSDIEFLANFDTNGGTMLLHPGTGAVKPTFAGTDATASTVSFNSDVLININGNVPNVNHDVFTVAGAIDLNNAHLVLTGSYAFTGADTITIVSASSVMNEFENYTDGATVSFDGQSLVIHYTANSVYLTKLGVSGGTLTATIIGNDLIITDADGTKDNHLSIMFNGMDYIITEATETFASAPMGGVLTNSNKTLTIGDAAFSGRIIFHGQGGNDVLSVVEVASLTKPIDFHGGSGNDEMNMSGVSTGLQFGLTAPTNADGYSGTLGGIAGSFTGVNSIVGGSGEDYLLGRAVDSTWTIDSAINYLDDGITSLTFAGINQLVGGAAVDHFVFKNNSLFAGIVYGGSGYDHFDFSDASNTNGVAINFLANNAGNIDSSAHGFSNVENFTGTGSNDTFAFGVHGVSVTGRLDGGGGMDTLSYAAYASPVRTNLNTGTATAIAGGLVPGSFENLIGGSGNDILIGNQFANVLQGNGGHDVLLGGDGSDTLFGGTGNDILIGGDGADTMQGDADDDIFIGGTTSYDPAALVSNNYTAFVALMAEWSRTSVAVATRWSRINGSTSGGLNGAYKLNNSAVFDDGDTDNILDLLANDRTVSS